MSFGSGSFFNQSLAWSPGANGKGFIKIEFPFKMDWYHEQPCKKFRSLEHRKELKGFQHEFLLLQLDDGSICRIERIGDPAARFDALSMQGCKAYDLAQCYRPEDKSNVCFNTSELIASVHFPREMDLEEVLKICRAIHECDKTRNYTLQGFNCYFFSLAVQCCLAHLVAEWEEISFDDTWESVLQKAIDSLPDTDQFPLVFGEPPPLLLRACSLLGHSYTWSRERFREEIYQRLSQENGIGLEWSREVKKELWYSALETIMSRLLSKHIQDAASESLMPNTSTSPHEERSELERCRRECIALLLNLGSKELQTLPKLEEPEYVPNGSSNPNTQWRAHIIEMDYHGVVAAEASPEQAWTVAQWMLVIWCHLKVLVLWILNLVPGPSFGRVSLSTEPGSSSTIIVEKRLEYITGQLDQSRPIELNELRRFCLEINTLYGNKNAVWGRRPWYDVEQAVVKHLPPLPRLDNETATLEICLKENTQPVHIPVSVFQQHIQARIKYQGELVQRARLGKAAEIQAKLRENLSQVWLLIRDNESALSTMAAATNSVSTVDRYPVPTRRMTDGVSIRSGETGPILNEDAAYMASVFRAAMRNPDFASRPDEVRAYNTEGGSGDSAGWTPRQQDTAAMANAMREPYFSTRPEAGPIRGRAGSLHAETDGASTRSSERGPISGEDAVIMANAFRAMLRKPDFASRPEEEGESPEERNPREQAEVMREQLMEEGRDIRSVRSERGVRVSSLDEGSEDGIGWMPLR